MAKAHVPYSTKYGRYLRSKGVALYVDSKPAQEHIAKLIAGGLGVVEIARRANLTPATVQVHGPNGDHWTRIRPWNSAAILSVRLGPLDLTPAERLRGGQRLVQGLMRAGFTSLVIGELMGLKAPNPGQRVNSLPNLLRGDWIPSPEVYAALVAVATKLETAEPADYGITPRGYTGNRSRAKNRGWVPLGAWDFDTVHLAESRPEWTGSCGTPHGEYLHKKFDIPVCEPCAEAGRAHKREQSRERRAAAKEGTSNEQ